MLGLLAASLVLLALVVPTSAETDDSQADGKGAGLSYWGPIPPETAETTKTFHTAKRSAWEWPLYGAYRVAGVPLQLFNLGVKGAVIGLDESGIAGRIANLFGAYDLPYGFRVVGDVNSTVGGGIGLTFFHEELLDGRAQLQTKVKVATGRRAKTTLGVLVPRGEGGSYFDIGGGYTTRGNAHYYGIGPGTVDENESVLTREMSWAGATYRHDLGSGMALEGLGLWTALRSRGTDEDQDDPNLEELFADELPFGYGEHSDGFDLAFSVLHDDTDTNGRPTRGGVRRFKLGYFAPTTDDDAFLSYRGEVTQFLRLWHERGLALRGVWTWLESDDPIHFQRLFRFDKPDEVRGFAKSRFRDRGMTFFSAEYRFPTWAYKNTRAFGIDTYLFFDWGQVFGARDEIALRNFQEGYGGGVRWVSRDGFGGSFEVALSEEEVVLRLRTDQNFQFSKQGFYHGRIPVPSY